ncbi:L-proline trans-4-hydroxylase-like [Watersipora subatra]|uniref:L-proline trans-4-hydroxylase-like n=1 Tax=Watersipora subatra TaxID=2589382 RepID=UPI00355AEAD9
MDFPEHHPTSTGEFIVTEDVINDYNEWGFILVINLLDKQEIELLRETIETDDGIQGACDGRADGEQRKIRVTVWKNAIDDVTGMIARSEKIAGTFQKLLNDEVYHYHGKLIMKDAKTGGAHIWHQDYGYWYNNGFLFPDLGTVFIPIDDADRENGCLKFIPKSHKAGRIEHLIVGGQAGADTERVAYLQDALGLCHVEMKAGDVLFFHSNLLHRSEQNHSERRRWAYLIAYCAKSNTPPEVDFRTRYSHLDLVPNSAIKECQPAVPTRESRGFFSQADISASLKGLRAIH